MAKYFFLTISFMLHSSLFAQNATDHQSVKKEILNCFRDEPGSVSPSNTKTYTAALRYDFLNKNGEPSVDFILVHTDDKQAKDEVLYSLSGFKLNPASKLISKTILHGPTTEDIKALALDEKNCNDWMKEAPPGTAKLTPAASH